MTSDVIHRLKQILGKYEQVRGIQVFGSEDSTPTGVIHVLRVDANGRLEIVGAGGAGLATEATLLLVEGRLDGLDDALTSIGTDQLRVDIIGQGGLATQATLLAAQISLALLDNALQSIGTDYLLIGDAGAIINLDALGHVQVDVLTSALPAGAATAANQTTMITSLQLIDDLRNALNSVAVDELRVLISDPTTPANRAAVLTAISVIAPNLDNQNLLGTHALIQGWQNSDTTIGIAALTVGADDVPNTNNQLVVAGFNYGFDPVGGNWDRIGMSGNISRDLNVRIGSNTDAVNIWADVVGNCYGSWVNENPLLVTGVIHGEDLEVGPGNSEPFKVRADDGSLPESEKHLVVLCLNMVKDGNIWIPMTQPS